MADSPFQIPKKAADFAARCQETETLWEPRNRRFAEDARLFAVQPRRFRPTTAIDEQETVTSNEGRAQVQQAVAYLERAEPDLHVALADSRGEDQAQALEDWARDKRDLWSRSHARGLRHPLLTEEGLCLLGLGWLCTRVLWNPDPAAARMPFDCLLLNPAQVFPALTDRGADFILHAADLTVSEIEQDWPKRRWDPAARDYLDGLRQKPDQRTKVWAIYTETEMAAMVGQTGWLKRPTTHGYGANPIQVNVANGLPWRDILYRYAPNSGDPRDTTGALNGGLYEAAPPGAGYYDGTSTHGWTRYYGVGLLDAVRQSIKDKEESLSMLKLIVAKMAVPGWWLSGQAPQDMEDPPRGIGEVSRYKAGESANAVFPPAVALTGVQALLGGLQRYIDTGALGPPAFGAGDPASGFDRFQQTDASLKILELYITAYTAYLTEFYSRLFRMFARLGQQPSPYITTNPLGRQVLGPMIDPMAAVGAEEGVTVRFKAIQTQDFLARVTAGVQLKRERLASPYYIQTEMLGIPNPTAEARLIAQAAADEFPPMQQWETFRIARDKAAQAGDQEKAAICDLLMKSAVAQLIQVAQPPAPPAPPAGPPGMGGPIGGMPTAPPQQPPIAGLPIPSQALPDELGPNAGMVPNGVAPGPFQPGAAAQPLTGF